MKFISNTLLIEEKKMQKLISSYEVKLIDLPRGSITTKKRGIKEYYYLGYRDDKRVISQYIGSDTTKLQELQQNLAKRQHIERMISALALELKLIQKIKGRLEQ